MDNNYNQFSGSWAVILGGSSGFGFAAVKKLAAHGMNIATLYRETAITEAPLKKEFAAIAAEHHVIIKPYNLNATDETARSLFISDFKQHVNGKNNVKLLLHSIARGNLKPLIATDQQGELSIQDIQATTYAMATSMLDWARVLLQEELFETDARVIGLTSDGAHKYWEGYAAVSVAKASLESLATYMAVELSKFGVKTNLIQAGITATSSLKKIPGSDKLIKHAKEKNPSGRITVPGDVANVIYLLCTKEAAWINGSLIHVDGGEHCL